jgi:hypothetical protein
MKGKFKFIQLLGTFLFSIGIALGLFLLGIMVWGDLEASLFASEMNAQKSIGRLHCPIILSSYETGEITATFKNPTDKDWERFITVDVSQGFITLKREIKTTVPIPAGGKGTASWQISHEDAAYNRIILFHIFVSARYPYPSLDGSCGVVVMNLWKLTGIQILMLITITALVCIILGIFLWKKSVTPYNDQDWYGIKAMYALAIFITVGLVIGYFGAWVVALLCLAVSVLMVGIIIGRKMTAVT